MVMTRRWKLKEQKVLKQIIRRPGTVAELDWVGLGWTNLWPSHELLDF